MWGGATYQLGLTVGLNCSWLLLPRFFKIFILVKKCVCVWGGGDCPLGSYGPDLLMIPGADPGFRRGGRTSEGWVSYMNFRSGSKLLQGPGQINKQTKIANSRGGGGGGGGVRSPQKNPVSAHGYYVDSRPPG